MGIRKVGHQGIEGAGIGQNMMIDHSLKGGVNIIHNINAKRPTKCNLTLKKPFCQPNIILLFDPNRTPPYRNFCDHAD